MKTLEKQEELIALQLEQGHPIVSMPDEWPELIKWARRAKPLLALLKDYHDTEWVVMDPEENAELEQLLAELEGAAR